MDKGDRVAYLGRNDIATFETMFAAGLVGAIFVPLNTRLSAPEIRYMLEDCGAKVLVHGPDTAPLVEAAAPLPSTVDLSDPALILRLRQNGQSEGAPCSRSSPAAG